MSYVALSLIRNLQARPFKTGSSFSISYQRTKAPYGPGDLTAQISGPLPDSLLLKSLASFFLDTHRLRVSRPEPHQLVRVLLIYIL
jgi:hypothetical protein